MKFPDSMTTPPVPASPEKSRIPVMFSATGGWGLPLGVAIHTLCLHASSGRFYDIHIVHDGMDARIIQELNQVAAPFPQVSLSFLQLPEEFRHLFQNGNKDRYSPLAYARLMAGSLFPQYGRIVYLDADVLLAGDVAELYFSDLRGASVAAAGDGLALWSIEKGTMHPHLEYMGNYLSSPFPTAIPASWCWIWTRCAAVTWNTGCSNSFGAARNLPLSGPGHLKYRPARRHDDAASGMELPIPVLDLG